LDLCRGVLQSLAATQGEAGCQTGQRDDAAVAPGLPLTTITAITAVVGAPFNSPSVISEKSYKNLEKM
jgi:hypothetical protein